MIVSGLLRVWRSRILCIVVFVAVYLCAGYDSAVVLVLSVWVFSGWRHFTLLLAPFPTAIVPTRVG